MRVNEVKTDRKIYTLTDFRGVDYASSPLEVKPYRATDMANLLLQDGVLKKRKGWQQLFKAAFSSVNQTETPTDIIPFGKRLFVRCIRVVGEKTTSIYREMDMQTGEIKGIVESEGVEAHASIVEYKGVLYVADGTYFKLFYEEESGELCKVLLDKDNCEATLTEEKQPYVPTTTINITALEADSEIIYAYPRAINESLSLLTPWRKNMIVYQDPNQRLRYKLDGVPYEPSVSDMAAENGFYKTHYPVLTMEKGLEKKTFAFEATVDEDYPDKPYWTCKALDHNGKERELVLGKYSTLEALGILTEDAIIEDGDAEGGATETPEGEEEELSAGQNREIGFLILPTYFRPWEKENTWEYEDIVCTVKFVNAYDVELADEIAAGDSSSATQNDSTGDSSSATQNDSGGDSSSATQNDSGGDSSSATQNDSTGDSSQAQNDSGAVDRIKTDRLYRTNVPCLSTVHGVEGANDRIFIVGKYEKTRNYVYYSENEVFDYLPTNQFLACGDTNAEITAFEKLSDGSLAVFKDVPSLRETAVYYITGRSQSLGVGEEGNEYFMDAFSVSGGTINKNGVSARSAMNYDGDSLFCSKDGVYAITLSENLYSSERYAKERSRPISPKLAAARLENATAIVYDNRYWLSVADGSKEVYIADSRYRYSTEGTERTSFNYEWFRLTNIPAIDFMERNDKLYFLSSDGWLCKFHDGYTDIYREEKDSGDFALVVLENGVKALAFNKDVAELVSASLYAEDENGEKWEIENIRSETLNGNLINVFDVPEYVTADDDGRVELFFHVPVKAHWQSVVTDLGSGLHRKNLWGISVTTTPTSRGRVSVGYKTRRNEGAHEVEGAGTFDFGGIDFALFSFDAGGFINAYRQRTFERGFVYLQLYFSSDNDGDAVVNELAVEYAVVNKNIGLG